MIELEEVSPSDLPSVVIEPDSNIAYIGAEMTLGSCVVCCDCNAVLELTTDTASVSLGYGRFRYYCDDCKGVLL